MKIIFSYAPSNFILSLIYLLPISMVLYGYVPGQSNKLENIVVVLDPGHGGKDNGATGKTKDGNGNSIRVNEDEYCMQVALLTKKEIEKNGGVCILTVVKPGAKIIKTTNLKQIQNELFYGTNTTVFGKEKGIQKRIEISNKFLNQKKFRGKGRYFISIHADVVSNIKDLPPRTLYNKNHNKKNKEFAKRFSKFFRWTKFKFPDDLVETYSCYVFRNRRGYPSNLRVLDKENKADFKILLELVNMNNTRGAWRLRNYDNRAEFAKKIVDGLLNEAELELW